MDNRRLDTLARHLAPPSSRRLVVSRLTASLLSFAGIRLPNEAGAKPHKRHGKRKKKPLRFNEFGCLNVGARCRGKDDLCCSGICHGKKPRKGAKDKRRCVAHHVAGCTVARDICTTDNKPLSRCNPANMDAYCATTTGNGPFCANFGLPLGAVCQVCVRDVDCLAFGYPPGSACVLIGGGVCNQCIAEGTEGRACVAPGV